METMMAMLGFFVFVGIAAFTVTYIHLEEKSPGMKLTCCQRYMGSGPHACSSRGGQMYDSGNPDKDECWIPNALALGPTWFVEPAIVSVADELLFDDSFIMDRLKIQLNVELRMLKVKLSGAYND